MMLYNTAQSPSNNKLNKIHATVLFHLFAICFSLLLLLNSSFHCMAQDEEGYYEISVFVDLIRVGGTEVPSIVNEQKVLLSITDLFNFLKINYIPSRNFDTISGFFINLENSYIIDKILHTITFQDKVHQLTPENLMRTETGLYLDSKYFGEIFGLECVFNIRNLTVKMNTELELPIMKEIRIESVRQNIQKLNDGKKADTIIDQSYPGFSLGTFDWSINSIQQFNSLSTNWINLALGSMIAGGETNISVNYNSNQVLTNQQFNYNWRYVNNNLPYFKQILVGKVNPFATSTLYNALIGIQITNIPTTYRRSFGTYTLSDYTKPGWTVELYVNNVLLDFKKADASGFFSFEVPLVYGNTEVNLRFYGPWGEEEQQDYKINIPFSFAPKNKMEYRITGGVVENDSLTPYTRVEINYGLSQHISIGGGFEYLSSITSGSVMPFINTTISLTGGFLLAANYTHGVQLKAMLSYQFKAGLKLDLEYIKYRNKQQAILHNYLEQRKIVFFWPIRIPKISLFSRFSFNQYILSSTQYINTEWVFSGSAFGVSANITTFAIFSKNTNPFVYSNLSMAFRVFKNAYLRPNIQYNFNNAKFISTKLELEKRIKQSNYLSLLYEKNFINKDQNIQIGIRFNFPYAQTGFYAGLGNKKPVFSELARGGLLYESKTKKIVALDRPITGRGTLIFLPFLDINNNGKYDIDEPKIEGLEITNSVGLIKRSEKDTTLIVTQLNPYSTHHFELNFNRLDNIAWQLKYKSMNITANPNQSRLIEIPVSIVGEVSGMVLTKFGETIRGQERIIINFYNNSNKLVASTMSEYDGYFIYLGLEPGAYTVKIDENQLKILNKNVTPDEIHFEILPLRDGDIVDNIEFILYEPD